MKKEIIEFKDIVTDLYAISESPNFSDEMRNKASNLQYYINKEVGNLEPIIKKSGETWVARYDGVDYLAVKSSIFGCAGRMVMTDKDGVGELIEKGIIKPISEIKITDEIAKLRPIVVLYGIEQSLLVAVDENYQYPFITANKGKHDAWKICRLATVSDLEES